MGMEGGVAEMSEGSQKVQTPNFTIKSVSLENIMYSMVTIVNNAILYI